MAEYTIKLICQVCEGSGLIHDQNSPEGFPAQIICSTCGGTGEVDGNLKFNGLWDKILDLENKCNGIMVEQASQRVDLTSALSAIWNKVKDL